MYQAIVDIVSAYKWAMSDIEKLYLSDSSVYGLFFWQERAKEYTEKIKSQT